MKKFSQRLIFIIGLFVLNNSFGSDGQHNVKDFIQALESCKKKEVDILHMVDIQESIILKTFFTYFCMILKDASLFMPLQATNTKQDQCLMFQDIKPQDSWEFNGRHPISAIPIIWINLTINIILLTALYKKIDRIGDLDEHFQKNIIQKFIMSMDSDNLIKWLKLTDDGRGKIQFLQTEYDQYEDNLEEKKDGILKILKDLDTDSHIVDSVKNLIEALIKSSPLRTKTVGKTVGGEPDNTDNIHTDYHGSSSKSSQEVLKSLAEIIFSLLEKSQTCLYSVIEQGEKRLIIKLKIANIDIDYDVHIVDNKNTITITSLGDKETYIDVKDVKKAAEKIPSESEKNTNKFKSDEKPQDGKKSVQWQYQLLYGLSSGLISLFLTNVIGKLAIKPKPSKKQKNPSMDNNKNYPEQSFDKLQTGAAAA